MEIKTNTRNELFSRNEIQGTVEAGKNPSYDEVKNMIAEKTAKNEENIEVLGIKGSFGSNKFEINAYVYDSKEDLEKAVQKTQKQKKTEAEDMKKANKEKLEEKKEEILVEEKEKEKGEELAEKEKAVEGKAEIQDKHEQVEENSKPEITEAPVEERAEEEKAETEKKQGEEEAKEN